MLIEDIYNPHPETTHPDLTVKEALEILIRDKVNGMVVVSPSERVVGVLSLQDIAAATVPSQFRQNLGMAAAMYRKGFFTEMCQEIADQKITTIMRKNFVSAKLSDNIMTVTADFLKNDLYIVPVIDKQKLIGVVTRTEIKDALAYGMGLSQHVSRHAHEKNNHKTPKRKGTHHGGGQH